MLSQIRQQIISNLWQHYRSQNNQMQIIERHLPQTQPTTLDHFAVIDLPGPATGIPVLTKIFKRLGYQERGKGYLPEKQNDFLWLAETDTMHANAACALPQAVVADFRPEEFPEHIRQIIEKYASQSTAFPFATFDSLLNDLNNESARTQAINLVVNYFQGRDWPLPTTQEFHAVKEFNELLAWVLVFGRQPNHFTISVHLLDQFQNLNDFCDFVHDKAGLELNHEGGVIKGTAKSGIVQGSTTGVTQSIALADGTVELPTGFVEFVWRYPAENATHRPTKWQDYFTGFVAAHANHVIESLYTD